MRKLDKTETATALHSLPAWGLAQDGCAIQRDFELANFIQAFSFMTQIAMAAETRNHHPEWSNIYNRVSITWTTHDVNGLSDLDIALAQYCEHAFANYFAASTVLVEDLP